MIQFTLECACGHRFESWFRSADDFDRLEASGMLSCPQCGSENVGKALMAPSVSSGMAPHGAEGDAPAQADGPDGAAAEKALAELRTAIESNSEYVGENFVEEARQIHDGAAPERSIHGEARPEEARKLAEDGIPVLPLPFVPSRKIN